MASFTFVRQLLIYLSVVNLVTSKSTPSSNGDYDHKSSCSINLNFDSGSLTRSHLVIYRPGRGIIWILERTPTNVFTPIFSTGNPALTTPHDQGHGIGGFLLGDTTDRIFTFDYNKCGIADHLVLYGPGQGLISIVAPPNKDRRTFSSVYASDGTIVTGIGGWEFNDAVNHDQGLAFDFTSSGRQDHLIFYRPGTGKISIIENKRGNFKPVFQSNDGILGFDLTASVDRIFAFDYDHSGKLDHLVLYRPGTGIIIIVKNINTVFSYVYDNLDPICGGTPPGGIGFPPYDICWSHAQMLAFDFTGTGKLDYIVGSTRGIGTGPFWILQNTNGVFTPVYRQNDPGNGIGGYLLRSQLDTVLAYDYDKTGVFDHFVAYRPDKGIVWILKNDGGSFIPIYEQGDPSTLPDGTIGLGIGGYNLLFGIDIVLAYDYYNPRDDHSELPPPFYGQGQDHMFPSSKFMSTNVTTRN